MRGGSRGQEDGALDQRGGNGKMKRRGEGRVRKVKIDHILSFPCLKSFCDSPVLRENQKLQFFVELHELLIY